MYKKVIWATDGSEAADRAMPHANAIAAESGAPMVVVHCEEYMVSWPLRKIGSPSIFDVAIAAPDFCGANTSTIFTSCLLRQL